MRHWNLALHAAIAVSMTREGLMRLRPSSIISMLLGMVCGVFLSSEALALRSAMTGVNFEEVELRIVTVPQYKNQLYERAFAALSKAGLTPQRKVDRQLVEKGKAYILIITLFPNAIDGCPNLYSYTHRAELQEWVYFDRVQDRAPLMSWFMKDSDLVPHVIKGRPSVERLEEDLDNLLSELIKHYEAVNHPAN